MDKLKDVIALLNRQDFDPANIDTISSRGRPYGEQRVRGQPVAVADPSHGSTRGCGRPETRRRREALAASAEITRNETDGMSTSESEGISQDKSGNLIPTYPGICKSRHLIPGLSQSTKPILGYETYRDWDIPEYPDS